MKFLVIDSCTSISRVRLVHDGKIIDSSIRKVGTKDVSISGDNKILKKLLRIA
jgi:hypothetical protein